jgi:hypothetical protein
MTNTNVLQEVVTQYCHQYQAPANLDQRIRRLEEELAATLTLEFEHQEAVAVQLTQLRADRFVAKIDSHFKRINMGFMSQIRWQGEYQVPVFAAFELKAIPAIFLKIMPKFLLEKMSECRIWATSSGGFQTHPVFLEDLLSDGVEKVMSSVKSRGSSSKHVVANFKVAFSGQIPKETREKINQARKMGLEVFIVSEAQQWSISEKRIPIPEDPLVIGYKANVYWLIDKFDLTPTERWVAEEFTS